MATSAVSSVNSAQGANGLNFQSLLQIILTQLTYQDPLKPMDNFQFVSQLAQFSELQQLQSLNDQVTSLLSAQATTQATSLLGHTVDVLQGNSTLSGVVQAVALSNGTPTLTIKDPAGKVTSGVAFSTITQVR